MNYEQRYNEALKVIESLYNVVKYQSSTDALLTYQTLEKAFPELKESEDEKMMKGIIKYLEQSQFGEEPYLIDDDIVRCYIAWLENKGEQKPAWSEEDEKMWSQVIDEIEAIKSNSSTIFEKNIAQDKIDWLKFIKERIQPQPKQEPNHWKPSDEQMKAIKYFIDFHKPQANASTEGWGEFKHLESLYNDLLNL